jgi:two-component system, chemotaxis family, protein-glutamate methylesterase/glutaminase
LQNKDIVVVGTSAGGVDALRTFVAGLPDDLKAAVFIVMHSSPEGPGLLDQILDRSSKLPVVKAVDRLLIQPGMIVVAVPDHHLLLEKDHVRVTRGPRENMFRPAVDPLFRSAAEEYGPRVISVVLTGGLDDGASGTWTVKKHAGTCIVQDPAEALAPSMPRSALRAAEVDYCVPLVEIAPLVMRLTMSPAETMTQADKPVHIEMEVRIANEEKPMDLGFTDYGVPSNYACPECHGVLLDLT